jgi:hypothetical protein
MVLLESKISIFPITKFGVHKRFVVCCICVVPLGLSAPVNVVFINICDMLFVVEGLEKEPCFS